jgi:hypothetical protein
MPDPGAICRGLVPKTIEADSAPALDTAVAAYLASLDQNQRMMVYEVRAKPDGSGWYATLLTSR